MMPKVRKALRIAGGFGFLLAGGCLAIPGVPGPGIAVILLGLVLLSDHFAWAKKTLAWTKERYVRLRERARQVRSKPRDGEPRASTELAE